MSQPNKISQLIDNGIGDSIPKRPIMPSGYNYLKKYQPDHHLVTDYDRMLQIYQQYEADKKSSQSPQEERETLPPVGTMDINNLMQYFNQAFYLTHKVKFDPKANNGEANIFLYTLLYYFAGKENFYKSSLLYKGQGVSADLKKGLLVIGGFGCGKTSFFKAFHYLFNQGIKQNLYIRNDSGQKVELARYGQFFKYFSANQVVEDYECLPRPEDKDFFWNNHIKGRAYFDDVLTERKSNNYGQVEMFKDILEKRYDEGMTTLISCNYIKKEGVENVESTLWNFGKKYGGRVYDRLFSMFNIITLKGKSLRK